MSDKSQTIREALDLALDELLGLKDEYREAASAARSAASRETQALNDLNAKQKEVDKMMTDLRLAVGAGDWSHPRRKLVDELEANGS